MSSSTTSGPAAMPTPRSNKAPYFTDQSGDPVEVFLREYENLAITHGLTSSQKVEQVLRYVSLELCDLWQFLDGYTTHSWSTFKRSIEEIYGEASVMSRYSKQRLREFIKHTSKSRMTDEDDVHTYYKRFLVLSKPLMENHRITEEECDAAFWGGFHLDDRKLMYPRLIGNHPHHPKGQPFDYEDVLKVACAEFTNRHFTAFTIDDDWEPSFPEESTKPDPIFQWWFGHEAQDPRASDGDRCSRDHSRYPTFMDLRRRDDTP